MYDLWKSYFRREVCDSESLVLAEELVAASASPDVDGAHYVAVVDEVYDAIIDDVVLVSQQDRISSMRCHELEKA